MQNPQKITIKLKAYDHRSLDREVKKIVNAVKRKGGRITGPVPLPRHKAIFTVIRSPHVYKNSREQFELGTHSRVMIIEDATAATTDILQDIAILSGIEIEIKI